MDSDEMMDSSALRMLGDAIKALEKPDVADIHQGVARAFQYNLKTARTVAGSPWWVAQCMILRRVTTDVAKSVEEAEALIHEATRPPRSVELTGECDDALAIIAAGAGQDSEWVRLLEQVLVMIWGAFETLSRDLAKTVLLEDPTRILNFPKEPTISASNLLEHDRDVLLEQLVEQVIDEHHRATPEVVAKFFRKALPGCNMSALYENELRMLAAKRHIIVHRCGLIDAKYQKEAKKLKYRSGEVGSGLLTTSGEVLAHFQAVVEAGRALLAATGTPSKPRS